MHGGRWYQAIQSGGHHPKGWLDLSSSISPYGPGPKARAAWAGLLDQLDRYPDPDYDGLLERVVLHYGLDRSKVVVTAGAIEALDAAFRVLAPKRLYVVVPCFSEYRTRAEIYRIPVQEIRDPSDLKKGPPGLVAVANPVNPTGRVWSAGEMTEWLVQSEQGGHHLMVDEAFLEFLPDWRDRTLMGRVDDHPGLSVVASLTKFYGLAALRLGFWVSGLTYPERAQKLLLPWRISWVSSRLAEWALSDQEYFQRTRVRFEQERTFLRSSLEDRGLTVEDSQVNYLLVSLPEEAVDPVLAGLFEQGILVRDARPFRGLAHPGVRIAVKRRRDSQRLILAWDSIMSGSFNVR